MQGHYEDSIDTLKEAEKQHRDALLKLKAKEEYDEEHDGDEVMAIIRQTMAEAYMLSYRLPMAMGILKQTLASRKHILGVHHLSTLETNYSLGLILLLQFNVTRAVSIFDELILHLENPEMVSSVGTDSLILASCHLAKGHCMRIVAKFDEAKSLYSSALRMRKLFYGDVKHPACAEVVEWNAFNMYLRARTYASAEPAINQCLETCQKMLGDHHPQYARALYRKGNAFALVVIFFTELIFV